MDPESAAFQPQDDLWRFQNDMLRVQQSQAELADRVSRLERRHDDDSRLKNVWGTTSPFPSVLGGTPQQVPIQQPTAEHFSNFDDHSSSLIGNLQLDADDEPRRIGTTSRANSVRFDETANHGHWAHASRSSLDLIPRTGSGLGGHLMSERSYSHKSDGRQSSAGHSAHSVTSGRANSLTGFGPNTPLEPPGLAPGLFILGPVPAIIRCWLGTDFKHDTLLYAAVCSGSYTSCLDLQLIERLAYLDQVFVDDDGTQKIKLSVYLPEAIPLSASSRSSSPAPQLPSLTVEFSVIDDHSRDPNMKAVQIFLGSDVLRAHNADVLFSSNQLTLYDDEQIKVQIPLIRPEDDRTFKSLRVTSRPINMSLPQEREEKKAVPPGDLSPINGNGTDKTVLDPLNNEPPKVNGPANTSSSEDGTSTGRRSLEHRPFLGLTTDRVEPKDVATEASPASATPRPGTSPAVWSNWRRDTDKPNTLDWANVGKTPPAPAFARKDTGMKVLKPLKATTRSLSGHTNTAQMSSSPSSTGQSRFFDEGKRRESGEPQLKRTVSAEKPKDTAPVVGKPNSTNPIGGASAFPWLNSSGTK